jgi:hypothetical protein
VVDQGGRVGSRDCARTRVAIRTVMHRLRQQPLFAFDHEARKQIRDTRVTLLEHLRTEPDDLKGLVLADVIGELDPDRDLELARHRMRFREKRPADWRWRAKELGLDRVLYSIAFGMQSAGIGKDAIPILERRAAEIGEARAPDAARGAIDETYIPAGVTAAFHPSGHLARAHVFVDKLHEGELVLAEEPGSGHYRIVEKRGGYGTMICEDYRDGCVVTTLNTPWHDGEESSAAKPWTRWVEECLADLARLSSRARAARRR